MLTPQQLAKSGSEHAHQTAFFAWVAVAKMRGFDLAEMWAITGKLPPPELDELFPAGSKHVVELEWIFAIPNGGSRGDTEISRKIEGGKLKAEGVRAGVADIFLPVPAGQYHGLFIEMKKPEHKPKPGKEAESKGGLSEDQIRFKNYVKRNGYGFVACYSWQEAVAVVTDYIKFSREFQQIA